VSLRTLFACWNLKIKSTDFDILLSYPPGIPEIGYLRQVADDLMVTVARDVEKTLSTGSYKGVVLKFIVGKPEKKPQLRQP